MRDPNSVADAAYRLYRHRRKAEWGPHWPGNSPWDVEDQKDYLNEVALVRALVDAGYPLKTLLRELEREIPKERRP